MTNLSGESSTRPYRQWKPFPPYLGSEEYVFGDSTLCDQVWHQIDQPGTHYGVTFCHNGVAVVCLCPHDLTQARTPAIAHAWQKIDECARRHEVQHASHMNCNGQSTGEVGHDSSHVGQMGESSAYLSEIECLKTALTEKAAVEKALGSEEAEEYAWELGKSSNNAWEQLEHYLHTEGSSWAR